MGISITEKNEIRLLIFMFTIKKKKEKGIDIIVIKQTNKQTNKLKWDIHKRLYLEVACMFNEQFTNLARKVFGNPTLNSCFKFLKRYGIFYFCRDFVS